MSAARAKLLRRESMATAVPNLTRGLNQTLSDLITLDLSIRQARRNLTDTPAQDVHRFLDSLADAAREGGNRIAARSMRLGHKPDLWTETAARMRALRLVAVEQPHQEDVYPIFEQFLEAIIARLHVNISASDSDLVTQSLMVCLADRLDTITWAFRARRAA
jgi:DNA-binding ferritin-like protein